MKKFVLAVLILSLFASPMAFADTTGVNLDTIRTNCNAARSMLQRIVSSEKTSRINRGQSYDRTSKLFANFAERLRQNRIDNQKFVNLTNEFNSAAANFRSNYDDYKNSIDTVINSECSSRPGDFYNDLTNARNKRQKVNDEIRNLKEITERYKSAVSELSKSLYGEKTNE